MAREGSNQHPDLCNVDPVDRLRWKVQLRHWRFRKSAGLARSGDDQHRPEPRRDHMAGKDIHVMSNMIDSLAVISFLLFLRCVLHASTFPPLFGRRLHLDNFIT